MLLVEFMFLFWIIVDIEFYILINKIMKYIVSG